MKNNQEYYKKYQEMLNKNISVQDWKNFCYQVLNKLMIENQDILKRMKDEQGFKWDLFPLNYKTDEIELITLQL